MPVSECQREKRADRGESKAAKKRRSEPLAAPPSDEERLVNAKKVCSKHKAHSAHNN